MTARTTAVIGVAALATFGLAVAIPSPAQPPASEFSGPRPGADAPANPDPEFRLRAREEVQVLESFARAKQSQLREADERIEYARAVLAYTQRLTTKGMASELDLLKRKLDLTEAEARRDTRAAELDETRARLARARRRLGGPGADRHEERGDTPVGFEDLQAQQLHLERRVDRLRTEMDAVLHEE